MAKNFEKFRLYKELGTLNLNQKMLQEGILYNYNKLENTGSINHLPRSEPIPNETRQNAKIELKS